MTYLQNCDAPQLAQTLSLMYPMLDTLPALNTPSSVTNTQHLAQFLMTITPLTTTHPALFAPNLQALLNFLPALILPSADCGPTPTVAKPFPSAGSAPSSSGRQGAFVFPPVSSPGTTGLPTPPNSGGPSSGGGLSSQPNEDTDEKEAYQGLRLAALEFMVSLSEAKPSMVRKVDGWVPALVRACLEGMGELDDGTDGSEEESLRAWLDEDVRQPSLSKVRSYSLTTPLQPSSAAPSDSTSPAAQYEQAIDRLACATGGRAVLPPAFQYIPSMLASYDWRVRHAGLMAIAAIAEGTGKVSILRAPPTVVGLAMIAMIALVTWRREHLIPHADDPLLSVGHAGRTRQSCRVRIRSALFVAISELMLSCRSTA